MTRNSIIVFFLFLSGCTGDTLDFRHQGNARIEKDSICITSSPNDVLRFYLLTSSLDNYQKPLAMEDNIARKYPDTCINADVVQPADYDLMYKLNEKKYRLSFTVGHDGFVHKQLR